MVVHHPDTDHPAVVPEVHTTSDHFMHLPLFAKELIAGGVAGGLAKTSMAPLERVKILFQTGRMSGKGVLETLREIYSTEGTPGFFRGNGASVLRIVPYAALHYGAYEHFRQLLLQSWGIDPHDPSMQKKVSPVLDLVAGSAAGATAVLATYPLDLVRTRLAYSIDSHPQPVATAAITTVSATSDGGRSLAGQPSTTAISSSSGSTAQQPGGAASNGALRGAPSGQTPDPQPAAGRALGTSSGQLSAAQQRQRLTIRRALATTLQEEGVRGLYRGIGPTLVGILPYAGLKFYVYQSAKQHYRRATNQDAGQRLPVSLMLTFGAVSGLVAQTATYPLDVVRRRMQVQSLRQQPPASGSQPQHMSNTWQGLRLIYRTQGLKGLFTGLSINYMKVVPATAIGFTLYDSLKQALHLENNL